MVLSWEDSQVVAKERELRRSCAAAMYSVLQAPVQIAMQLTVLRVVCCRLEKVR